jgi:hypothetical protein
MLHVAKAQGRWRRAVGGVEWSVAPSLPVGGSAHRSHRTLTAARSLTTNWWRSGASPCTSHRTSVATQLVSRSRSVSAAVTWSGSGGGRRCAALSCPRTAPCTCAEPPMSSLSTPRHMVRWQLLRRPHGGVSAPATSAALETQRSDRPRGLLPQRPTRDQRPLALCRLASSSQRCRGNVACPSRGALCRVWRPPRRTDGDSGAVRGRGVAELSEPRPDDVRDALATGTRRSMKRCRLSTSSQSASIKRHGEWVMRWGAVRSVLR